MEEVILMGYITREKHISERVIDPDGICFTLMAMTHGYGPGCYKFGAATLLREKGAIMTKVIEIYEDEEILRSEPLKGQEGQDSEA